MYPSSKMRRLQATCTSSLRGSSMSWYSLGAHDSTYFRHTFAYRLRAPSPHFLSAWMKCDSRKRATPRRSTLVKPGRYVSSRRNGLNGSLSWGETQCLERTYSCCQRRHPSPLIRCPPTTCVSCLTFGAMRGMICDAEQPLPGTDVDEHFAAAAARLDTTYQGSRRSYPSGRRSGPTVRCGRGALETSLRP